MDKPISAIESSLLATEDGRVFLKEFADRIRSETISEFESFTASMRSEKGIPASAAGPTTKQPVEAPRSEPLDEDNIKSVMNLILNKINATKTELESISQMGKERNLGGFNAVEDELAAINFDTERATNTIMDGTDAIEGVMRANKSKLNKSVFDEVMSLCHQITMACSFQDITGQRVKKVVEVVQLIDSQILTIERRLNTPVGNQSPVDGHFDGRKTQKERGLLEGPALPSRPVDQAGIDALFEDD